MGLLSYVRGRKQINASRAGGAHAALGNFGVQSGSPASSITASSGPVDEWGGAISPEKIASDKNAARMVAESKQASERATEREENHKKWLGTPEGQEHVAHKKRLAEIEDRPRQKLKDTQKSIAELQMQIKGD